MHSDARTIMLPNGYPDWDQSTCAVCGQGWPCLIDQLGDRLGIEHYCTTCSPIFGWLSPIYGGCKLRVGTLIYHSYCADLVRTVQMARYQRGDGNSDFFDIVEHLDAYLDGDALGRCDCKDSWGRGCDVVVRRDGPSTCRPCRLNDRRGCSRHQTDEPLPGSKPIQPVTADAYDPTPF